MRKIDWYISDDGKCDGPEEKVKEYEEKQKSPLYGMHFPYAWYEGDSIYRAKEGPWATKAEREAILAFANLAPLIARWADWDYGILLEDRKSDLNARGELLRAFDEACKLIPKNIND